MYRVFIMKKVIAIFLIIASIFTMSGVAAFAEDETPYIEISNPVIKTYSSRENVISGDISYACGQKVVLYDSQGSPLVYVEMGDTKARASFRIDAPDVKVGTTRFYVKGLAAPGVKETEPVAVDIVYVEYVEPEHPSDHENDGPGGANAGSTTAENIALIAESMAWPKGTSKSKYWVKKGGGNTREANRILDKWHQKRWRHACNILARMVLNEALGTKLHAAYGYNSNSSKWEEQARRELKPYGFEVFDWDGKESSLQRGDVVFYQKNRKSNPDGHTYIYLGPNKTAEAQQHAHGGTYFHISSFGGSKDGGLSNKVRCVIVRHTAEEKNGEKTGIQILGKITKKTGKIVNLPESDDYTFQSFCYNNGNYYMMRPKAGGHGCDGYIYQFDSSMAEVKNTEKNKIGHGNGCAYCTADGMIYSVTIHGVRDNTYAQVIDPATLTISSQKKLKHGTSGIAYDRTTNRFITSSGTSKKNGTAYFYVYESDLATAAGAKKIAKLRYRVAGDLCAHNGIIALTLSGGDNVFGLNNIDMYDENTGAYLGSYSVNHGEIEGIDVDESGQIILMFKGRKKPYVQYTGININEVKK